MSEKTEQASPKKKRDARKKGNLAKSKEVVNVATFVGIVVSGVIFSDLLMIELKNFIKTFLTPEYLLTNVDSIASKKMVNESFFTFASLFLPFALIIIILGVIGHVAQTGFLFIGEPLKPSFSKMNPINGFKNMFSMKALGTLVKDIIIILFLGMLSFSFLKDNFKQIINIGNVYTPYLHETIASLVTELLMQILLGLIVVAVIDYGYQKYTYNKQLRMTKEEVKEEFKQQEGDPQIKGRIKQKQRQLAQSRMMKAVPEATVVLVNPTHIAIALRYEEGKDSAPVVVAKGADYVAFKIRDIAKEHDIPIIENKPLARALYKQVDIDKEIPVDFYQVVSEILITVYKLKKKKMYKK